jgi:hypothetical protein
VQTAGCKNRKTGQTQPRIHPQDISAIIATDLTIVDAGAQTEKSWI